MLALVVRSGPLAGERIELTRELIVGREHADLTIDDPEMSRRHAVLRPRDGGAEVEDLGSTNGTLVDGERIVAAVILRGGERIKCGETVIEIEAPEVVDDGATRLRERPPASDETVLRAIPSAPSATEARSRPEPGGPVETPPPLPPAREPVAAEAAAPMIAPPSAQSPQARSPAEAFGSFSPPPEPRRRAGVATRLWVPMVLTFATVAGTAIGLILYFANR